MTSHRSLMGVVLVGMAAIVLVACGDGPVPTYRAGGKVVFPDGKPMQGGRVEFRVVNKTPAGATPVARGEIQPNGTFELSTFRPGDGAVEGEHLALVVPPPPPPGSDPLSVKTSGRMVLDPRFMQYETSGLKFTVSQEAGKNQFTLQVNRPHG